MAKGRKTGGRAAGTPNEGKPGRPSLYSQALAEKICERLGADETLHEICAGEDMPKPRTVYGWAEKHADFSEKLDARPKCLAEQRRHKSALVLERKGVASCEFHGEIELTEVFDRSFGPQRSETPVVRESRS